MKVTKSAESPSPRSPVATAVATIGTAATASVAAPSESVAIGSAGGKMDSPVGRPARPPRPRRTWRPRQVRRPLPHQPPAYGRLTVRGLRRPGRLRLQRGNLAILTGVIAHADPPGVPGLNIVGRRVGVSVQDNTHGHDRIGWSWGFAGFDAGVLPRTGPVQFFETTHGGYVVR